MTRKLGLSKCILASLRTFRDRTRFPFLYAHEPPWHLQSPWGRPSFARCRARGMRFVCLQSNPNKVFWFKILGGLAVFFNAVCVCNLQYLSLLSTTMNGYYLPVQKKKSSSTQNVCHVSHYLQHTAIGSRFHTTRPASKPMCTQVSINNVCPKA